MGAHQAAPAYRRQLMTPCGNQSHASGASTPRRGLRWSVAIYRRLLGLYPPAFRQRWAELTTMAPGERPSRATTSNPLRRSKICGSLAQQVAPPGSEGPPWVNYSYAMALRTSRRAARMAGRSAATRPTKTEAITYPAMSDHGKAS
jgi:hypothetical protein